MLTSITQTRGRNIDVRQTMQHIGVSVLMSVGYQPKTLVYDVDYLKFKVSRRFWLVVKLNGNDLYDVEVAVVYKSEYQVCEQVLDVPAERLSEIVREVGDRT